MLIKMFSNGKGGGAGPVDYLTAREVLAYDNNRDLIRDEHGTPEMVTRDPLPEVLRGNSDRMIELIDACRHQWSYRAGVISFADNDAPSEDDQQQVMDAFEALAFAGLDGEQYECLWVRHSHEDRVELHFCTPRMELTTGKSLNIAPPGYQKHFDSLRDLMNKEHGWADPMDIERALEAKTVIEASERAHSRESLHGWIVDQISVGLIQDRAEMLDALTDAGFEIPRAGAKYITVKDPETDERWRLKGEIFHDDWQAENTLERETERGLGADQGGARRLDAIELGELQARFEDQCARRAEYNRDRYPHFSALEPEGLARSLDEGQALDPVFALDADGGSVDADLDLAGSDISLELEDGRFEPELADAELRDSENYSRGADLSDLGPHDNEAENMHTIGTFSDLPESGGIDDPNTSDGIGTRIAGLRRAVGENLGNISKRIARIGTALDRFDDAAAGFADRLHGAVAAITNVIGSSLERVAERCRELRGAGAETARELEISEGRREAFEITENHHSEGLGL
ncbi:MAG: relaxase/mobilization nuclease domain-containing protein [Rhizobiaceae bacterium]